MLSTRVARLVQVARFRPALFAPMRLGAVRDASEKIEAISIRPGFYIMFNDAIHNVKVAQHVKPGKGGAYMQVEMRNIETGSKAQTRLRSSETVERIVMDDKQSYSVLYTEGNILHVMHPDTYEQLELPISLIGEQSVFLKEGISIEVAMHDSKPVRVVFPATIRDTVSRIVDNTSAGARGSTKLAQLSCGAQVTVPQFVNEGDEIIVRTEDSGYVERAKK